jgi:hypothetical protein
MSCFLNQKKKIQKKPGVSSKYIKKPSHVRKQKSSNLFQAFSKNRNFFEEEADFYSLSEIDDNSKIKSNLKIYQILNFL